MVVNPFRWKWALFVLFGIAVPGCEESRDSISERTGVEEGIIMNRMIDDECEYSKTVGIHAPCTREVGAKSNNDGLP